MNTLTTTGRSFPIGATLTDDGVNFSLFSRNATGVELLFFDQADDARPARVIRIDPSRRPHLSLLACVCAGSESGAALRLSGAWAVRSCARGCGSTRPKSCSIRMAAASWCRRNYSREAAGKPRRQCRHRHEKRGGGSAQRTIGKATRRCTGPPRRPSFTKCTCAASPAIPVPASPRAKRGTYAGLIEKIPYLQELGITAVELLPVFQFDAQDCPPGRVNYWGYAPMSFFAPHQAYSSRQDPLGPLDEFRDMVKALHRAGIEVILDVVFNHTAEGNQNGPTLSFRGLENSAYYILEQDRSRYANYSGTGNTLNANHPIVRRMIVDSLRYWVEEMHVDGFRFDLASILARDASGHVMPNPPVLWDIESDPVLAGTKLIAEAWDAAGLYQVGSFVGDSWKEWNGRFPRRCPQLLPRRRRFGRALCRPVGRQPRDLRPRGTRAGAKHQLRDLSRRLHPERPGFL